jgi:hypothetical protein
VGRPLKKIPSKTKTPPQQQTPLKTPLNKNQTSSFTPPQKPNSLSKIPLRGRGVGVGRPLKKTSQKPSRLFSARKKLHSKAVKAFFRLKKIPSAEGIFLN